ncbi:MAG: endonuclease/exonuclease/phosphatase family protein [Bacteroidales bacterium]|nr:endonuclease/exonuclease/phosphatase family protein [Bacteroidales bacterium]
MARKGRRRRVPRFFGITFRLVLIVAGICLLLSYVSSYIDPTKFSIPMFFGLYFIPILAINFLFLVIALLSRSKSAWITLIALLPALLFAERFVRFGGGKENGGQKIRIETYNVGLFRLSKNKMTYGQTMDSVYSHIEKSDADIVCLQEVYLDSLQIAKKMLPQYQWRTWHLIPHQKGQRSGNIIFSRFPITNGGLIKFKSSTNLSLYADIVIGEDTVRVYNNHLQSYAISPTALLQKIRTKKTFSEEVGNEIINVHNKFRNSVIQRSHQVNAVLDNIKKSPYPSVVCGDFNDIPMSYTYHKLSYGSKDTFKESGKGFSATFSVLWPLFRIDYIFIPESFNSISHKTIRCNYSDHYPVVAEFAKQ